MRQNRELESAKTAVTLSIGDRGRLDELTDFYRHLNNIVESIIDKFSTMEKVQTKFIKQAS